MWLRDHRGGRGALWPGARAQTACSVCGGIWVQGVVRGSLSGGLYSLDEMAVTDPS